MGRRDEKEAAEVALPTEYLNVDLELRGAQDLRPLVDAFGESVFPLHVAFMGDVYFAGLELSPEAASADQAIQEFVALVKSLPADATALWKSAMRRDFNIGIQAAHDALAFECALTSATLQGVAEVGARVVFTVYGSGMRERKRRR